MPKPLEEFEISLNDYERATLIKIDFDLTEKVQGPDRWKIMADSMEALIDSLMVRDAIPASRLRYFADPAYLVGGHGESREQVINRSGGYKNDVFRNPAFAKHLRYFIYGPSLPANVIEDCKRLAISHGAFLDRSEATQFARKLARANGLDSGAAEEFYKLALDCGFDVEDAKAIRRAVMSVR
jgi:hypothetical protein